MRKSKKFTIDEKEYIIKEISTQAIIDLFEAEDFNEQLNVLMQDVIDITVADFLKLYPGEQEQLIKKFCEVNASFLVIARYLKLEKLAGEFIVKMIREIQNPFIQGFSGLLKEAMSNLENTGIASSKQQ